MTQHQRPGPAGPEPGDDLERSSPGGPADATVQADAGAPAGATVQADAGAPAGATVPADATGTADATGSPPEPAVLGSPRTVTVAISGIVTALLLMVMITTPVPYAIESPGPTVDVLGEVDGRRHIAVEGATTYPTQGELLLTTVLAQGGPGRRIDLVRVVRSWLARSDAVVPVEDVYPREQSLQERTDRLAALMTTSEESAVAAALTELGYEVPAVLTVAGAVPGSGAEGVLLPGDVVVAAAGTAVPTFQALADLLGATPPGTTLAVQVERDGEPQVVDVVTGEDSSGGSVLGVFLDADFDYPVAVDIGVTADGGQQIVGPSAGMLFALGVLDVLTPGAMTGGERIAGTGTITIDGEVGPITGVRMKVFAASRDGAAWFLAPLDNCAEALRSAPDGLRVIGVADLSAARDAVTAIGEGRAQDLPGCDG